MPVVEELHVLGDDLLERLRELRVQVERVETAPARHRRIGAAAAAGGACAVVGVARHCCGRGEGNAGGGVLCEGVVVVVV